MSGTRTFGAYLEQESVVLVEYVREKTGFRVLGETRDDGRNRSIDQAIDRLIALLQGQHAKDATVAIAIHQFGAIHHVMALPEAPASVVRPIIRREIARAFGVADVDIGFTWGGAISREEVLGPPVPAGAKRVFVGAAPATVSSALVSRLTTGLRVQGVTVVPEAIRRVFNASTRSDEPTAVLVCVPSGPHLCFFVDGQLELAIEPPIGLDTQVVVDPAVVLDQLERGAVFLRQQFGGTQVTDVLLAAPANSYSVIQSTIESKMGIRVKPLSPELSSPQAVLAVGAVLATTASDPLDLMTHPPTVNEKIQSLLKGPRALATSSVAAAVLAIVWAAGQVASIQRSKAQVADYRSRIESAVPAVAPMRDVAQQRSAFTKTLDLLRSQSQDRAALTRGLAALANGAGTGVMFDNLSVSRSSKGWTGAVEGVVNATEGADAMRALDNLYQSVRSKPAVATVDLDQVEYGGASDSIKKARGAAVGVSLQFRLNFTLAPAAGGSR